MIDKILILYSLWIANYLSMNRIRCTMFDINGCRFCFVWICILSFVFMVLCLYICCISIVVCWKLVGLHARIIGLLLINV